MLPGRGVPVAASSAAGHLPAPLPTAAHMPPAASQGYAGMDRMGVPLPSMPRGPAGAPVMWPSWSVMGPGDAATGASVPAALPPPLPGPPPPAAHPMYPAAMHPSYAPSAHPAGLPMMPHGSVAYPGGAPPPHPASVAPYPYSLPPGHAPPGWPMPPAAIPPPYMSPYANLSSYAMAEELPQQAAPARARRSGSPSPMSEPSAATLLERNRERNKLHARRSRMRKKVHLSALQVQLEGLTRVVALLRGLVVEHLGSSFEDLTASPDANNVEEPLAGEDHDFDDQGSCSSATTADYGSGSGSGSATDADDDVVDNSSGTGPVRRHRARVSAEAKLAQSRERNRLHARRSRLRKKQQLEAFSASIKKTTALKLRIEALLKERLGPTHLCWASVPELESFDSIFEAERLKYEAAESLAAGVTDADSRYAADRPGRSARVTRRSSGFRDVPLLGGTGGASVPKSAGPGGTDAGADVGLLPRGAAVHVREAEPLCGGGGGNAGGTAAGVKAAGGLASPASVASVGGATTPRVVPKPDPGAALLPTATPALGLAPALMPAPALAPTTAAAPPASMPFTARKPAFSTPATAPAHDSVRAGARLASTDASSRVAAAQLDPRHPLAQQFAAMAAAPNQATPPAATLPAPSAAVPASTSSGPTVAYAPGIVVPGAIPSAAGRGAPVSLPPPPAPAP